MGMGDEGLHPRRGCPRASRGTVERPFRCVGTTCRSASRDQVRETRRRLVARIARSVDRLRTSECASDPLGPVQGDHRSAPALLERGACIRAFQIGLKGGAITLMAGEKSLWTRGRSPAATTHSRHVRIPLPVSPARNNSSLSPVLVLFVVLLRLSGRCQTNALVR